MLANPVIELSLKNDWNLKDKRLLGMSKTACAESISPRTCTVCKGKGSIVIMKRDVDCEYCNKTGYRSWSKRRLAKHIGVDKNVFNNTLYDKYVQVLNLYDELDNSIARALSRLG